MEKVTVVAKLTPCNARDRRGRDWHLELGLVAFAASSRESGSHYMRDCLIVVGMHRSGTSALAGALDRLGADFGDNLVEAQDDNVRGYYEHRRILELHEGLLAEHGSSWDDLARRDWTIDSGRQSVVAFRERLETVLAEDFGGSELWAVKDPRLSHLLPLWLPVLERLDAHPRVIVACRNPSEVAGSLARRDGFSREKSGLLWLQHNLAAERASRPFPRAFVDYADLLGDPAATLSRAGLQLDLPWPVEPAAAGEGLSEFVDAALRHQRAGEGSLADGWGRIGSLVPALAAALRGAGDDPSDPRLFDEVASEYASSAGVDPLVLEHIHQFGRREVRREVWAARRELQERLTSASDRLGEGLRQSERHLEEVSDRLALLEKDLDRRSQARKDRAREVDRTLSHLSEALSTVESGVRHLEGESQDLRARIARWSDEVDVEGRLTTLEAKVARWGDEVDVEGQLVALQEKLAGAEATLSELDDRAKKTGESAASLSARVAALETSWWKRLMLRIRRLAGEA